MIIRDNFEHFRIKRLYRAFSVSELPLSALTSAMSISTSTDIELLAASQRGQLEAFAGIVGRYQPLISAVSFSTTGDQAMSEDVTQETFLTAWADIDSIREPSKLRGWLCGIARNLALAAYRRSNREVATTDRELAQISLEVQESPLDAALSHESDVLVWDALQNIPDLYRVPIVMHYRENCSIPEIAESLGITRTTVQQRLSRGRRHLRKGVTDLVERTLSQHKPAKGLVATITGLIAAGAAPAGAHASQHATELEATTSSTGAMSMLMKVLLGFVLLGSTTFAAVTIADNKGKSNENRPTATSKHLSQQPSAVPSPTAYNEPPVLAAPLTLNSNAAEVHSVGDLEDDVVSFLLKIDGKPADDILEIPSELAMCIVGSIESTATVNIDFLVSEADTISNITIDHPYSDLASVTACLEREMPKLALAVGDHRIETTIWVVPEAPQPEADATEVLKQSATHSRGPENAAITIMQFSNFGCPYSGQLLGTLDQLFEEYPGKLRLIVKQGSSNSVSRLAALAVIAASTQAKYWPMHDRLFQNQGAHTRDDVIRYAEELGLDLARFRSDLDSAETSQLLAADLEDASALGVAATPTLIINGVRVRGALSIQMYRDRFDMILDGVDP